MTEQNKTESKVVKMQKLRRVVDRLRNFHSTDAPIVRKKSWLERLKARLGIGNSSKQTQDTSQ